MPTEEIDLMPDLIHGRCFVDQLRAFGALRFRLCGDGIGHRLARVEWPASPLFPRHARDAAARPT